jgi:hypothetical protein
MARPKKNADATAETTAPETAVVTSTDLAALIEQNKQLMAQNAALVAALVASRESGKAVADRSADEQVRIENLLGTVLAFSVTDPRTGIVRNITLEQRGSVASILRPQVDEIKEKYPHFFRDGYLGCNEVAANPNTIPNFKVFLEELTQEQIDERIEQITSTALLFDLFNHIENQRFTHLDERGQPLTEKDGDKTLFTMKETPLPFKLAAVERAVQQRLQQLTDVKIALDI